MIGKRHSPRLLLRASWMGAAKVILTMVTLVFAASISINSTTYQAEIGSAVNVTHELSATDKGFSVASANSSAIGTSCANPVQFSDSPGTASTSIVVGDLVYNVQVNSSSDPAIANRTFTVALVLASSNYGPLCIQGASTPAFNQTIDCKFDVGATLPVSPYSFSVTVQ